MLEGICTLLFFAMRGGKMPEWRGRQNEKSSIQLIGKSEMDGNVIYHFTKIKNTSKSESWHCTLGLLKLGEMTERKENEIRQTISFSWLNENVMMSMDGWQYKQFEVQHFLEDDHI